MYRFIISSVLCVIAVNHAAWSEEIPVIWQITEGLQAPESAYVDHDSGILFLSQIGEGGGDGKDGDGWISKLSVQGEMLENKWVEGFNSPKGLRSHEGTLWVSDIDRIVAINIEAGEVIKEVPVPEAQFLNDLATGPDGAVYVADMLASKVYKYHNDELSVYLEGSLIESPNGLLVSDGQLILGAWGLNIQEDFSTQILGRLIEIDMTTLKRRVITTKPTGNLDGVESDGLGGYTVTDWRAGKVFHIAGNGTTRTLLEFDMGAADHAFLIDSKTLILPHMMDNTLTAYDLSEAIK
ncbi:MAG: hypothetical protein MK165_12020 [Pirellulaceae bacterium]|nr:hypothetical protein [Pirellulaceae bacterium]